MQARIFTDDGKMELVELPKFFTFKNGDTIILQDDTCGTIESHKTTTMGLSIYVSRFISTKDIINIVSSNRNY